MCIYVEMSVGRGHDTRKGPERQKEEDLKDGEDNRTHVIWKWKENTEVERFKHEWG